MNKTHQRILNYRALIALLMVCSFIWLPVAGIALHFADAAPFQPTRHLLMTVHNLAVIIFLIAATLHLRLNWKPMLNYITVSARKCRRFGTELGIAVLIVTTTLELGLLHVFALR